MPGSRRGGSGGGARALFEAVGRAWGQAGRGRRAGRGSGARVKSALRAGVQCRVQCRVPRGRVRRAGAAGRAISQFASRRTPASHSQLAGGVLDGVLLRPAIRAACSSLGQQFSLRAAALVWCVDCRVLRFAVVRLVASISRAVLEISTRTITLPCGVPVTGVGCRARPDDDAHMNRDPTRRIVVSSERALLFNRVALRSSSQRRSRFAPAGSGDRHADRTHFHLGPDRSLLDTTHLRLDPADTGTTHATNRTCLGHAAQTA